MDRELKIAFGSSRVSKMWANRRITFEALCERLKTVIRTSESTEEYPKLPKDERDSIKDKGGLVGGCPAPDAFTPKFIFQLSHVARNGRLRNMQQFRSLVPTDFRGRGCIANSDARTLHS